MKWSASTGAVAAESLSTEVQLIIVQLDRGYFVGPLLGSAGYLRGSLDRRNGAFRRWMMIRLIISYSTITVSTDSLTN